MPDAITNPTSSASERPANSGGTNIAVVMACHNRREKTLRCIGELESQQNLGSRTLHIYVVDDGSEDGTSESISKLHPAVHLIQGDGTLYWTGGMRLAIEKASEQMPDYYLWLNDDTHLYTDSISRLFDTFASLGKGEPLPPIVVGSLRNPHTGALTYGGSKRASRWHPLRFVRIPPSSSPQLCDVFNGNLVLFHRATIDATGNLHPRLVHVAGDYEYALRAKKAGSTAWVAPGYLGECSRNALSDTSADPNATILQRYRRLMSIKGQSPVPRFVYYRAHGGPLWFLLYPLVYLRPLFLPITRWISRRKSHSHNDNSSE